MGIFERPLTALQKKNQRMLMIKKNLSKSKDTSQEEETFKAFSKLCIQDLTTQNYESLKIESQKSRLDYILDSKPEKKKGKVQRNQTSDLGSVISGKCSAVKEE